MELRVFLATLRRRWYLVVLVLVAAGVATYGVMDRVGPEYETEGSVLIFPPSSPVAAGDTSAGKSNPYLQLSSLTQARDILVRALTSKSVSEDFEEEFPGATFEATPDFTNSAPVIVLTVTTAEEADSVAALKYLMRQVPMMLQQLQAGRGLAETEMVTSMALTRDTSPTVVSKSQIRAGVLAAAAVLVLGLLLVALQDGLMSGRAEPGRGQEDEGGEAGADRPAKPTNVQDLVRRRQAGGTGT